MVWTTDPNTKLQISTINLARLEVPSYWHIAQAYIQILTETQLRLSKRFVNCNNPHFLALVFFLLLSIPFLSSNCYIF